MGPKEPDWVEVPDDWTDKKRSDNPEIARIQEFLGNNVKEEVIRRHLLAEGIGKPAALEIRYIETETSAKRPNELTVKAMIKVKGKAWKNKDNATGLFAENADPGLVKKDDVLFKRTFIKGKNGDIAGVYFDLMGVGKARLPERFAKEYYLRAIPFLRKVGVKYIEIDATTEADNPKLEDGRYIGAYVWCRYGYKNKRMGETIEQFLSYLQDDRKISLSQDEIEYIKSLPTMKEMVEHRLEAKGRKMRTGRDFLKGYDAKGKPTRGASWEGIIPDINNNGSQEMVELAEELLRK